MGLFDFFKKKEAAGKQESKILLAMPMFDNGEAYQLDDIINNLKFFWGLTITEIDGDNKTAVFKVDGEMVALGFMPVQIPWGDIEGAAQYAYNWENAKQELKDHNGHAIVSLMTGNKTVLERFRILSKVLCAILSTSNAIGIYQGNQSLLIPRSQYLNNVDELKEDGTPVTLWVYFGLRKSDKGNSLYTYGLTEFGKQEIEIINSKSGLEELYDFAGNIVEYVVGSDVTFKSGETLGYTADQKIKITSSKGVFVHGQSLKLEM
ncbi:MAG TPA: DUF4261 domain-containing protein, partial [Chitinophagaceae bacterium]|nr:DUF4261 domain-containing protein [Chitinophagaceae bacterium]